MQCVMIGGRAKPPGISCASVSGLRSGGAGHVLVEIVSKQVFRPYGRVHVFVRDILTIDVSAPGQGSRVFSKKCIFLTGG